MSRPSAARGALGWTVERATGSAADLHAAALAEVVRRTVRVFEVDHRALVLGSTQPDALVDPAGALAAGVAVTRRRSGGGAVLLEPGASTWVDLVIPSDDPLWHDDVGRAAHWVGDAWAGALSQVARLGPLAVHRGGMVDTPWSRTVCFAGLGPGEVYVRDTDAGDLAGPKVVGVSQRRTRGSAHFQCAVHHRWNPHLLVQLLALGPDERERARRELAGSVAEVACEPSALVAALLRALPST